MTSIDGSLHRQLANWLLRPLPRGAAKQVGTLAIGIASDVGIMRSENEDRVAVCRIKDRFGHHFVVVAVADGIGGMQDGMECAAIAIAAIFETVYHEALAGSGNPSLWLERALDAANKWVYEYYAGKGGTTVSVVLAGDVGMGCWATVGDSRVYESRHAELIQLSIDDTIAGQLGRFNEDSPEQSLLLQYVGMGPGLVVSVSEFERQEERQLLLCTDGVYFVSPDRRLLKQVLDAAKKLDAAIAPRRLVEIAKWAGGPDNASAAVVSFPANLSLGASHAGADIEVWDCHSELFLFSPAIEKQTNVASPEQRQPNVSPPRKRARKRSASPKASRKRKEPQAIHPTEDTAPQVQLSFSKDTND